MLQLEEALSRLLSRIQPLAGEPVSSAAAAGRVLAQDVTAPIDLPPFDNSAMDGYAVRAENVRGASPKNPILLEQIAHVAAGEPARHSVQSGQCVRIFTGSPLPPGSDAVVMQEYTQPAGGSNADSIAIEDEVKPWENVRLRGEDIRRGTKLLGRGEHLHTVSPALLGALGIESVDVHRRPSVGILATGSELVEPGRELLPGKIFESNRILLAHFARAAGAAPRVYPIVPDNLQATKQALETAFSESDVLLTSGGVSVGEFDYVKEAFSNLGGKTEFWKVAIRPGKPFVFGTLRDKNWFGLPGNPVSSLVTFLVLVRPALLKMQGAIKTDLPAVSGTLRHTLENRGDRRHFVRVRWDENGGVQAVGTQASHMLSSIITANGLVDMPPCAQWKEGTRVTVLMWNR